jgi:hypothetical protein
MVFEVRTRVPSVGKTSLPKAARRAPAAARATGPALESIRCQRRGEEADRIGTVLFPHLRETGGCEFQRLVPIGGVETAVAADHRPAQSLALLDGVVMEAAAHAELVAADGVGVRVRLDDDALLTLGAQVDRATD